MQNPVHRPNNNATRVAMLAVLLGLAACAGGSGTPPATNGTAPQDRSPLATPPSSMMTPHGY